ncbi:uncharacterized protein VICG_01824 [Vittaforma corneae ATCC 50505]|uniref:RNA helicase n=1 Tax=Vittaforma corneae (strain ATCC 50505) TaxID=993615 RepID=L2GKX2_VITCO|nr:uncharacterized protein VICG_01824 [Vittaforma corneae ATCC 50505]ELA41125.1 hypothetical protein VICG_01824 [Vittaforma corneae ATCC 50505]
MSVYVAPHLKTKSSVKEPRDPFTESSDNLKITTNSPYGKLDTLESLKCASNLSFSTPTVIQKYAIPVVLNNHSLLCRAPTGLGKTLCFLLPLIENIKYPQGLKICVVAPTRELCAQIGQEAKSVAKKLTVECVYGGSRRLGSYNHVNILIAAPGRLLDLLNSRAVNFSYLTSFVLDEADKLLEMGFEKEIRCIKSFIPSTATTFLFSATYHKNLSGIINEFLPPNRIFVEVQNETVENIKQTFIEVTNKDEKLKEILFNAHPEDKLLIFVQMKVTAHELEGKIRLWGYPVVSLHGDKLQPDRQSALNKFKRGEVNILVATSVAARGIDVQDIKTVINYDFPNDIKEYIHRIGRTGRQGRSGCALSFISGDIAPEIKSELVDILKESRNDIPDFLVRSKGQKKTVSKANASKTHFKKDGRSSGRKIDSISREIRDLTIDEEKEKDDSDEDLPGVW